MLRVFALCLALAALLIAAAMVPFGHTAGTRGQPVAPQVKRPPWPAWAHGAAAKVAPAPPQPSERSLSAPPEHERQPSPDGARLDDAAGLTGGPNRRAQSLLLGVLPLRGRSEPVLAPPPRSS
ncbi:MAG TPA: hypothetical protein VFA70_14180 [Dehalococcoidia bacterium]|jgi:hypothetical protein|nr:hypothetical protein [Dehalococcoidia bacterium]